MLQINSSHSIRKFLTVAALAVATATAAHATTITFDDGLVTAGSVLSNQYAGLGVTFAPGGGSTPGVIAPTFRAGAFAPNTDMSIGALSTSASVGAPLSGLILHTSPGWAAETANPVFTMTFSLAITTLSMDFGGNSSTQPSIFAVNPATGVAVTVASSLATTVNGTLTAVGLPTGTQTVIVLPGSYNDYVAVDNIVFTAVPEPSTVAASVLGLGALGLVVRRQRRATA